MRARLALFSALVLALTLAAPVAAKPPTGLYLALGDSLAVGDGASDWDATAYVPLMADYFAGTPHGDAKLTANLAVGGETTATFLAGQVYAAMAAIGDPTTDTKIVTLSIGGNDLLDLMNDETDACRLNPVSAECQGQVAYYLAQVATNYPTILGMLDAALDADPGDEQFFVVTLYNPFGGTGSPFEEPIDVALLGADLAVDCTALANPYNVGLDDIMACVTLATGTFVDREFIVVDGYTAIGDNALAMTHIGGPVFNIHPNDAGYAAIAEAHRLAARSAMQ
ncbi:MAG TPA: SGNH/GDSL hydrolase family protein [Candidatus Limnocylindria bacterium]